MTDLPKGLEMCDPHQRNFPLSWKEAYFRKHLRKNVGGYICPMCARVFRGSNGFAKLRGDHIHPFSKGGLTIWANLQLLCIKCNSEKRDKV